MLENDQTAYTSEINWKTKKTGQAFAVRFKPPTERCFSREMLISPKQKPQPRNSFFVKGDAVREKGFQPGVRMCVMRICASADYQP